MCMYEDHWNELSPGDQLGGSQVLPRWSSSNSAASCLPPPLQNNSLTDLQMTNLLGEGGFAKVFRGLWRGLVVGVKVRSCSWSTSLGLLSASPCSAGVPKVAGFQRGGATGSCRQQPVLDKQQRLPDVVCDKLMRCTCDAATEMNVISQLTCQNRWCATTARTRRW